MKQKNNPKRRVGKKILIIALTFGVIATLFYYVKPNLKNPKDSKKGLDCEDCNVVFINLTNTRKDHLSAYGYERKTTPNIDKFFKNSMVFDNAFAPASWTLPVAASLFTSNFPYEHKVMERYEGKKLDDNYLTLAEIFKKNGYKTAAITGGEDYDRRFNTNQGFDFYVDWNNYPEFGLGDNKNLRYVGVEKLVPVANDWLDKNKNKKFFLVLQGYDTHCPFTPKEPFDKKFGDDYKGNVDFSECLWTFEESKPEDKNGERYWPVKTWQLGGASKDVKLSDKDVQHMKDLYDGEIAQTDNSLESFFEKIKKHKLEDKTIFIFMSEHGDLFGEHGRFMRGGPLRGTFYDQVLNFPFMVKHPRVSEAKKVSTMTQTVDIFPTLINMLGLKDENESSRSGKNLLENIENETEANDYVFAATKFKSTNNTFFTGTSVVESVRSKEWKLIKEEIYNNETGKMESFSYELYNIAKDPKEENNIFESERSQAEILKAVLEKWVKENK